MKKRTAHHKKVIHHVSHKHNGLFQTKQDWFLFVTSTVVICVSVFYLFGLITF